MGKAKLRKEVQVLALHFPFSLLGQGWGGV